MSHISQEYFAHDEHPAAEACKLIFVHITTQHKTGYLWRLQLQQRCREERIHAPHLHGLHGPLRRSPGPRSCMVCAVWWGCSDSSRNAQGHWHVPAQGPHGPRRRALSRQSAEVRRRHCDDAHSSHGNRAASHHVLRNNFLETAKSAVRHAADTCNAIIQRDRMAPCEAEGWTKCCWGQAHHSRMMTCACDSAQHWPG